MEFVLTVIGMRAELLLDNPGDSAASVNGEPAALVEQAGESDGRSTCIFEVALQPGETKTLKLTRKVPSA